MGQYSAAAVVAVLLLVAGMLERVTVRRGGRDEVVPPEEVRSSMPVIANSARLIGLKEKALPGGA